jgi:Do/DeqQ family serine protease
MRAAVRLSHLLVPALAVLAACSDPGGGAQAQSGSLPETRVTPPSAAAVRMSYAPVVRRASPAVVSVLTTRNRPRDPWFELFGGTEARQPSRPQPTGSGVIVQPDGIVVTNNHVVEGAAGVWVALNDRRELAARVLLRDERADLAVLKIDVGNERLPTLNVDATEAHEVGDLVLAIGNPFGVGQTVTNGIISALNRATGSSGIESFIQTDAPINPGNSGGALVDMDGDLIGINTAILSRSGTSSGVGFAVPATLVRQVVNTAVSGGRQVVRPWLGVGAAPVTAQAAEALGLARPEGVLIGSVTPGSPAARAGLREGDIVLSAGGQPVNDTAALNFAIGTANPGDNVELRVRRDGGVRSLRVPAEPPPSRPRDERTLTGAHPMNGATVANLSPAYAIELGLPTVGDGVIVTGLSRSGYALRAGFRPGDIVRSINGRDVQTTAELQRLLQTAQTWRITVERNGQRVTGEFGA